MWTLTNDFPNFSRLNEYRNINVVLLYLRIKCMRCDIKEYRKQYLLTIKLVIKIHVEHSGMSNEYCKRSMTSDQKKI